VGKGAKRAGAMAKDLGVQRLGFRHIQKFEYISLKVKLR
jgi:hypothetical protein